MGPFTGLLSFLPRPWRKAFERGVAPDRPTSTCWACGCPSVYRHRAGARFRFLPDGIRLLCGEANMDQVSSPLLRLGSGFLPLCPIPVLPSIWEYRWLLPRRSGSLFQGLLSILPRSWRKAFEREVAPDRPTSTCWACGCPFHLPATGRSPLSILPDGIRLLCGEANLDQVSSPLLRLGSGFLPLCPIPVSRRYGSIDGYFLEGLGPFRGCCPFFRVHGGRP
jgi:hypothetical protein